jgi:hypothetical protein
MKKEKYEVEISLYPQTFEVEASDRLEAIQKAKELFHDKNNGRSVYEIVSAEKI